MDFLDRTEERERLTRLLDGRTGAFACLYGHRRCWKTLLVGEAKLSLTKAEAAHARAELKAKAALLPFAKDYRCIQTKLFVYGETAD